MNDLIKELLRRDELDVISFTDDMYGKFVVYGIETDYYILRVWNSSNYRSFDHREAMRIIPQFLLDYILDGSYSDGNWNEIMWEVIAK